MSESTMLVALSFAAAFIGTVAGAALVWRLFLQRANGGSKPELALQEMQHRLPALLQQTLKVEFEYYAQRQSERDGAQSLWLERRQADQELLAVRREERSVTALRGVFEKLEKREEFEKLGTPVAPAHQPDRMSACPPELLHTPLPRAAPVYSTPQPTRELTDEEIDALPADLPEPLMPRKRILRSPKMPTLRSL